MHFDKFIRTPIGGDLSRPIGVRIVLLISTSHPVSKIID
jgi:hypothetical protein